MNPKLWPDEEAQVNFSSITEDAEFSDPVGVMLGGSAIGDLAGRDAERLIDASRSGRQWLQKMAEQLGTYRIGQPNVKLSLADLSEEDRLLIEQVLGRGEVQMALNGGRRIAVQESVMAGVWRIDEHDAGGARIDQWVEIGAVPEHLQEMSLVGCERERHIPHPPEGTMNVMPVLGEIRDAATHFRHSRITHSINLSLLPMTPEDLRFLRQVLGDSGIAIESRGYGSCRIHTTAWRHVWSVQYFNSMDTMILNTLDIGDIPHSVSAAREDLEDSTARLNEILQAYFSND